MLNKPRLLTPGPTPLPENVRLALARDMIHHRKDEFRKLMAEIQVSLKILFGCSTPVIPLSSSGTGAMTAAVYSLFTPGQKVLVVEAGKFGERWREIALSRGLDVVSVSVPWGEVVSPDQVAAALAQNPDVAGVLVQLCETSTATLQPIRELGAVKGSALLVVDGISGVGVCPCPMDEWQIDCLLTGSQKGLMLPPGLALLALSEKAWSAAESTPPGCYYFNLPKERDNLASGQTNFTSAINLISGLKESLNLLLNDGLDAVYRKQWALTMLTRAGAEAMGLELLAKKDFAWGVTSILLPPGMDGSRALKIAEKDYGVYMAGGQDRLKGKLARLGHMGWVDWSDCLAGLCALAGALNSLGFAIKNVPYLETAMTAYATALAGTPGAPLPGFPTASGACPN